MANYTMELRRIIESYTQNEIGMKRKERIKKGTEIFFSEIDYPFYDEKERAGFQERFVMNFYLNEIGHETPAMFSLYLENWLEQNMPYWNQVYKNSMIEYDPLTNVNYSTVTDRDKTQDVDTTGTRVDKNKRVDDNSKTNERDYTENKKATVDTTNDTNKIEKETQVGNTTNDVNKTGNSSDKGTTSNDVSSFDRQLDSDTPQNDLAISANDGTGVIRYASSIKENKGDSNTKGTSSNTNENSSDEKEKGTSTNTIDTTSDEKEKGNEKSNEDILGNISDNEKEKKTSNVDNDRLEKSEKDLKENEMTEEIKKGKHGVTDYADMIMKQRKTFIRIEKQIFKEMKRDGLFMLVYSI